MEVFRAQMVTQLNTIGYPVDKDFPYCVCPVELYDKLITKFE